MAEVAKIDTLSTPMATYAKRLPMMLGEVTNQFA